MYTIKTSELKSTIAKLRKARKPFLILGTYGIGKSEMVLQDAQEEAEKLNRKFLDWNRTSVAERREAKLHPEKYYMFVDIRISQLDEGDLRGIPLVGNVPINIDEELELKLATFGWINYITKTGAAGTVFFDELNLARQSVTASAYSIINDKVISDRAISPDVFIVAAGNKEEDCDLVQPIAEPLKDRFAMAELLLDKSYWLDWASKNINPYLYAFCCWDKDMIHKPAKLGQNDKAITPRGIYNASCVLNQVDFENKKDVRDAVALCVGEEFALKFIAYYEHVRAINWEKLENEPESVENLDTEKQYAVMGAAAAKIKACAEESVSSIGEFFEKTFIPLYVLTFLPSDFVMASIKQFTNITLNCIGKSKNTDIKISVSNLLAKLFLLGIKGFNDSKTYSPKLLEKIKKIETNFKKRHSKVFTNI